MYNSYRVRVVYVCCHFFARVYQVLYSNRLNRRYHPLLVALDGESARSERENPKHEREQSADNAQVQIREYPGTDATSGTCAKQPEKYNALHCHHFAPLRLGSSTRLQIVRHSITRSGSSYEFVRNGAETHTRDIPCDVSDQSNTSFPFCVTVTPVVSGGIPADSSHVSIHASIYFFLRGHFGKCLCISHEPNSFLQYGHLLRTFGLPAMNSILTSN